MIVETRSFVAQMSRHIVDLPAHRSLDITPIDARLLPGYTAAVVAFGSAFWLRLVLDSVLPPGFPFLTFFPAVVTVSFFWGLYPGIVCAVLSAIGSSFAFIPHGSPSQTTLALGFFSAIAALDIGLIHFMHVSVVRLNELRNAAVKAAEDRALFAAELGHRIDNLFATSSALVRLAARHTQTPRQMQEAIIGRFMALGRSAELLRDGGNIDAATVGDLIALALSPMTTPDNLDLDRASLAYRLPDSSKTSFCLIFHELGTNALKYGALSSPTGSLKIFGVRAADARLTIRWMELGGPPPKPRTTSGFGSVLLDRLPRALGGVLVVEDFETGIDCTLTIPVQCATSQYSDLATHPLGLGDTEPNGRTQEITGI